jgi:WhiB family redox-sensing transcriptional regulator
MVHSQTNRSQPLKAVAGQGSAGGRTSAAEVAVLDRQAVVLIATSSRWLDLAACRDEDPELFYPVGTSGPAKQQEAEAKAVCARCPVRARCLEVALEIGDQHGVRGGMTEDERKAVIRAANKSVAEESAQETQPRQSA